MKPLTRTEIEKLQRLTEEAEDIVRSLFAMQKKVPILRDIREWGNFGALVGNIDIAVWDLKTMVEAMSSVTQKASSEMASKE